MSKFIVTKHDVQADKIVELGPLVRPGYGPLNPNAGVVLILENGSRHNWVPVNNEPTPQPGDYLVVDAIVGTTYTVPVAKFTALFIQGAA